MHLYDVPLIFALIGLVLYAVLGGADFGAGFWTLTAGRGPHAKSIRDHAHHAIGPVWEANHVWLIFVLVVVWTAYPTAFASIASTLAVPLFIAGVGIIFRGTTYALRAGTTGLREQRVVDTVFSLSSILTPFALGTVVGAIAARQVPVGNAAGDQFSSWTNATAIIVGVLAVATAAYLGAVFLCADAVRHREPLETEFRKRAFIAAVMAGALAIAALPVVHSKARPLWDGLTHGKGLAAVIVSIVAGLVTFLLLWQRRYEAARYCSSVAVAAVVAGWAFAQSPVMLPGLTIQEAAAPHDTLVAVIVATVAGAAILFPSLALLFRLVLGGRLGEDEEAPRVRPTPRAVLGASATGLNARLAGVAFLAGLVFLTILDTGWAHAIGATSLLAFVALAFPVALPPDVRGDDR